MNNRYKTKRFTIIEMLIVMAIIVLLAALLFPTFNVITKNAKKMKGRSAAAALKQAIETYYTTYGRYPFYDYKHNSIDSVPANLHKTNLKLEECDFIMPYPSKTSTGTFTKPNGTKGTFTGYAPVYKDDYGKSSDEWSIGMTDTEYYDTLIKVLSAADDSAVVKKYNPKKIVFLNGVDKDGKYLDPWGNRLGVGFDLDMSPKINPYPVSVTGDSSGINRREGQNVFSNVIVWSFGPNKINECGMTSVRNGTNPDTGVPFDDLPTWKE